MNTNSHLFMKQNALTGNAAELEAELADKVNRLDRTLNEAKANRSREYIAKAEHELISAINEFDRVHLARKRMLSYYGVIRCTQCGSLFGDEMSMLAHRPDANATHTFCKMPYVLANSSEFTYAERSVEGSDYPETIWQLR